MNRSDDDLIFSSTDNSISLNENIPIDDSDEDHAIVKPCCDTES